MLKKGQWTALALVTTLGACGSEAATPGEKNDDSEAEESTEASDRQQRRDAGEKKDSGSTKASKDAGVSAPKIDSGTKTTGADEGQQADADIPCEVARIVNGKCGLCHGEELGSGVPFPLVTLADFRATVPGEEEVVYDAAHERVNKSGPGAMPPASVDPLSAADKKTLSDWLKGGAKGGAGCTNTGTSGADAGAPVAVGGSGGAHIEPVQYDDPLMKCYEFRAFSQGSRAQSYSVPTTPDFYVNFNFTPPWKGTQYVRSFRSLIDNGNVIHHWLFFQLSALGDDTVEPNALGTHPDGQLLAGWAPGGTDLYFDPDVAFEVPGDVSYQMEGHYNNKTGGPAPDASGVELCVTPSKPKYVAGLAWVGTDAIFGTEAVGHCQPDTDQEIHLIQAQPHMHTKGRNMKVELQRASGEAEVIFDKPFDFAYQRGYLLDTIIRPGDQLFTTCTYSEFANFGKGTSDEMCYFFSTYYPKGALQSLGVGTAIHGANSCMDI